MERKDCRTTVYNWKIPNYSVVVSDFAPDEGCFSPIFTLHDGSTWHLGLYPQGINGNDKISLFLCQEEEYNECQLVVSFHIVKATGKDEKIYGPVKHLFSKETMEGWCGSGVTDSRDVLNPEKGYLQENGTLHLQCHMILETELHLELEFMEKLSVMSAQSDKPFSDFTIVSSSGKEWKVSH